MSLVLYRKYRPQTFSEVIGQEHVVKTLTNAILMGIISHAYLFAGPRGSGKTSLARLFAKAVNCKNRKPIGKIPHLTNVAAGAARVLPVDLYDYEPCNKCDSCLEINLGNSLDLIEIDAASHRGIDDIRELRDGIRFSPAKSKYKIFIIDECHQLTKEAANALLKTLEEPPSHAIFILATTEVYKMIPTILSRCQRFDFRKLTLPEIIKRLEIIAAKEKVEIEKAALELIALNSGGSLRDAESLLDQVLTFSGVGETKGEIKAEEIKELLGIVEIAQIIKFVGFLLVKKSSEAVGFLNELLDKGFDLQEFIKSSINYLRQALILKIGGMEAISVGLTKEELQKLQQHAQEFSEQDLRKILNLFLDAENKIRFSPIPQLPIELAIIEFCNVA